MVAHSSEIRMLKSSVNTIGMPFSWQSASMRALTAGFRAVPPDTTTSGILTCPSSNMLTSRGISRLAVLSGRLSPFCQASSMSSSVNVARQGLPSVGRLKIRVTGSRMSFCLPFCLRKRERTSSRNCGGVGGGLFSTQRVENHSPMWCSHCSEPPPAPGGVSYDSRQETTKRGTKEK